MISLLFVIDAITNLTQVDRLAEGVETPAIVD
jgi:hypothetical protein